MFTVCFLSKLLISEKKFSQGKLGMNAKFLKNSLYCYIFQAYWLYTLVYISIFDIPAGKCLIYIYMYSLCLYKNVVLGRLATVNKIYLGLIIIKQRIQSPKEKQQIFLLFQTLLGFQLVIQSHFCANLVIHLMD